jgi:T5SS/PEP-CTERM-associated repeat protein/autotransporter-associated beta strand protein
LRIGDNGVGNSLVISNGGVVRNSDGRVGSESTASNNSVLVTGTGSVWSNSGQSFVGRSGAGNSLVISNGGMVQNTSGTIGNASTASNNSVLVTGTGSVWSNSSQLSVGFSGAGSSLVISNGGMVQNGFANIGSSSTASNSSVLVTGAGSTWSNTNEIKVGRFGPGTLTVSDGGSVAATNILIGQYTNSAGTLNIGRFGTNDTAGTINTPTIAFGASTNARTINFNQSNSTTVSAAISGNGTVNQLGSGTTILSAPNTYTGATTVSAGKLVVDGSISSSTVTVQGGTLSGSGTVGGLIVTTGGTISPGSSPGNLTVANNMLWNGGGNYNWQVLGTTNTSRAAAGTTWDLITVTGALDLTALTTSSKFNINLWSLSSTLPDTNGNIADFNPTTSYEWLVVSASDITGFNAADFAVNVGAANGTGGFSNPLDGGYVFGVRQDGGNLYVTYESAAPIPEPGTWAAMAIFAGGAAYAGWRRRKSAKVSE